LRINTPFYITVGYKTAFPLNEEIYNYPLVIFAHGTAITPFMSVF